MNDAESFPSLSDVQSLVETGSFEEALAALESVVEKLERGHLAIDEAVAWYEAGLRLARRCTDLLEQAELRISTVDEMYRLSGITGKGWSDDES
jgi:exodeoxyribonuclease VII small subunit